MSLENILDSLFTYFNVSSIGELSEKLGVSQSAVSMWKSRNSINAIKKRCRELGIYDDIFNNNNNQMINNNHGQIANKVSGDQVYSPQDNPNSRNDYIDKRKANIDEVTYGLFKEAYDEAIKENKLNVFRIYLMEKNF